MILGFMWIIFFLSFGMFLHAEDAEDVKISASQEKKYAYKAQIERAKLYAYDEHRPEQALQELQTLLQKYPDDARIHLELANIYFFDSDILHARLEYQKALSLDPTIDDKARIATAFAEMGYYAEAEKLLHELLPHLAFQPVSTIFDFFKDEKIEQEVQKNLTKECIKTYYTIGYWQEALILCRELIDNNPFSIDLSLLLASTYMQAERYAEAEGVCKELLVEDPDNLAVLKKLYLIKVYQKDFDAALDILQTLVHDGKISEPYYQLSKASIYYDSGEYELALQQYTKLADHSFYKRKACIGQAKSLYQLGRKKEAESLFQAYPKDKEANFFAQKNTPDDAYLLHQWAKLYVKEGEPAKAITFLKKAIECDKNYIPARYELSQVYGVNRQYSKGHALIADLLHQFPKDDLFMLARARLYAWADQYWFAFDAYDKLIQRDPKNALFKIEKARAAYWAKMADFADLIYQSICTPSVDELLGSTVEMGIFTGYEKLLANLDAYVAEEKKELEKKLASLWATYKIQKSVVLESKAKRLKWDKRPFAATPVYEELIGFQPGNEEAIFDTAQIQCQLGTCEDSLTTYDHLLLLDPLHPQANQARLRETINDDINASYEYCHWIEKGYGLIDQISRIQNDVRLTVPLSCQHELYFEQGFWTEKPYFKNKNYRSRLETIGWDYIINENFSTRLELTQKNYNHHKFKTRYTGLASLIYRPSDYILVGISYERSNELYNYFGFKQGTQGSHYRIWTDSNITRKLAIQSAYEYLHYNDHNFENIAELRTIYQLTEAPTVVRISLEGEYRNTHHINEVVYDATPPPPPPPAPKKAPPKPKTKKAKELRPTMESANPAMASTKPAMGINTPAMASIKSSKLKARTTSESENSPAGPGKVVDIIHPYWTPRHYWCGRAKITLIQELILPEYCGNLERYIRLGLMYTKDNDHNRGYEFEAAFHFDLTNSIRFELRGIKHHSKAWKATGFWATLTYYF